MSLLDSPALSSDLTQKVLAKLQSAAVPLPVADAARGLPKGRGVKAADFQNEVRTALEELVRLGQAFRCPSGKGGKERYWARDEKHLLRSQAVELAAAPLTLAALKKELARHVKGVDGSFVESVVRELVREDRLFEHPAKTKSGGPLFGAFPPPPPLAQAKHKKALDSLVKACRKLLSAANVPPEELVQTLSARLHETPSGEPAVRAEPVSSSSVNETTDPAVAPPSSASSELEDLLLKAVATSPVLSLAELRDAMPAEYRGRAFDEAVLKLADEQQVVLHQDVEPSRFSEAEQAQFVRDGHALFTTISPWR
jgi:hypothetical protein